MKFLHTGDWHLGKTLHNTPLVEDQENLLKQVLDIFEAARKAGEPYDALMIPGDLYDRAIPSVAAVKMFDRFLDEMSGRFKETHVFILAGNHDGPDRLGFASSFLERSNIHICTQAEDIAKCTVVNGTAVYQIPFLMPGSFGDGLSKQGELFERAAKIIEEDHRKNHPDLPTVVCAHATVYGGADENFSVGTATSIDPKIFENFTYTALGHIHKFQQIGKSGKIFYSGSPIAYSFDDDAQKVFLSVEIGAGMEKPDSVEQIKVDTLHPVVRLRGKFQDFMEKAEFDKYKGFYMEIKSTDAVPIHNAKQLLKAKFPHLLSFVRESTLSMEQNEDFRERKRMLQEKKSTSELLRKFLEEIYTVEGAGGEKTLAENAKIDEKIRLFEKLVGDSLNRRSDK